MSEIRKRKESDGKAPESAESDHIDSEDDKIGAHTDLSKTVPTGTDKAPSALEFILQDLPEKWRNWVVRGIFSCLMIFFFFIVIYGGPVPLIITTILVQIKCFQEIINIGYSVYRIHGLPWFRSLSWYFLVTSNYYFYGENLVYYLSLLMNRPDFLRGLVTYHRFISFSLYCAGIIWFVLSLVNKYYMKQFSLFAWTHIALLIVVTQSYLISQNIFEGMIWFIVPVSMIICNDIMAYVCGFFLGKTPLIKVSPKKTWEGFIGGGIFTIIFGIVISSLMCKDKYFVCPVVFKHEAGGLSMDCEPSALFRTTDYELPSWLASVLGLFGISNTISLYPFVFHSLSLSLFSSIIGPFGGFFASGFKRAFKIKDFGDVIPGHGGIMDRFDCQFLMATFVNVYISSFIQTEVVQSVEAIYDHVMHLKPDQQVKLYYKLADYFNASNIQY